MAATGVGYHAGAGLLSPKTTWFGRAATQFPPPVIAFAAKRRTHSMSVAHHYDDDDNNERSWRDLFELAKVFLSSNGDGTGPPRWFSSLESGNKSRIHNSPLLLYLPGIDGMGLGLVSQHQKLGKIFDVWCLHIPVKDRTPFQDLVLLVEEIVRSENRHCPGRPIYLVGESVGGCLALAVAAHNPDIDLVLILANPATCYSQSQLQSLSPLLEVIPTEHSLFNIPYILSLMTGVENRFSWQATLDQLSPCLGKLSFYVTILANVLPRDTLLWKLQMIKSASLFADSRLHVVKAQILILASGLDPLFPNLEEAERICEALPKQEIRVLNNMIRKPRCEIRKFLKSGHFLLLEDDVDLVTIIKGTSFYRRAKYHDYVADYLPPTTAEFAKSFELLRWLNIVAGSVMLSTLESGTITRGLTGIPNEGPVLLVGNHTLLGLEVHCLVESMYKRHIVVRTLSHPLFFGKLEDEELVDTSIFDVYRIMGAIPVSSSNFYKLLSSHSHILLYPGGVREALHRKGEESQLFWPERAEFVRMAARFGAKIIPFGVAGEDDIFEVVLDYNDQMKIPYLRESIEKRSNHQLRSDSEGEVANQDLHFPGILPKLPGRYYYLFGKPIDTSEMKLELRDREKAHQLYLQVKSEVERCISYLKEKREKDPYRSLAARALYQNMHGSMEDDVPTFEL